MIDVKNGGWFWIRMTVRLLSLVSTFFTTKWLGLTYGLHAYFITSVVLDVLFFKVLRLKESNFKSPGYFKHTLQSTPSHYDRYVNSVINAKTVTFLLAHGIFLVPYFKETMEAINAIFMVVLTTIVFRYGFKFGYHQFKKEVGEDRYSRFAAPGKGPNYENPSVTTNPFPDRSPTQGLSGWNGKVYTGNMTDIGT